MRALTAARTPLSAVVGLCIVSLSFHIAIVATNHVHLTLALGFGELFKLGLITFSALTHWGLYGSLLLTFALTLRPGREALITGMARRLQGDVSGELALYTRRVTFAWCCFFAAQLTMSITLFCFAPLVVWSVFVNILDIPLVVAMFAAEYMCRLRCLRNPPRHSLAMILDMVANSRRDVGTWPALSDAARPD
ncbi:hypothetical protein GCM10010909_07920 [Acidocella aquatica]|uniref:Transmembrane protein n=1 Tax=Acidocella aquatica TaxID=1922313 RepID=A0ABQ6A0Z8_9PROT|nr:hypothetical protein [Acidocella aquatica]GLR66114.1 hypothetical protein GCM10010909_07920 [Acidocella aquatica]